MRTFDTLLTRDLREARRRWSESKGSDGMLEGLGNLGDFLGGIGVVVTLVYLAIQIRQNTDQLRESATLARVQAHESGFQAFSEFRSKVVCHPDVADLYLKGLREPEALEPSERLRFNLLASELFNLLRTSLDRIVLTSGADPEDTLDQLGVDEILRGRGLVQWWRNNRSQFPRDFAARIDARLPELAPSDRQSDSCHGRDGVAEVGVPTKR